MGNQDSVQCKNVCCDNCQEADGNPPYPVSSYPLFGDDRKHELVSDISDLSAPPVVAPERAKAAAHPLASSEKIGAAALKVFGVAAVEGDSVSAADIALALKRLAERIAGRDPRQSFRLRACASLRPVLGCINADLCKQVLIFQRCFEKY